MLTTLTLSKMLAVSLDDNFVTPLFDLIAATVCADLAPAGFEGRLAFGALGTQRAHWLQIDLGAKTTVEAVTQIPEHCSALLLLEARDIHKLFKPGTDTRTLRNAQLFGDATLLERFRSRFFQKKNALDVRLPARIKRTNKR